MMNNENIKGLKLSDKTRELLVDFVSSINYYHRWLMFLNDLLIVTANETSKHSDEAVECMYAVKHIRDLLEALQKDNPDLKDD